MSIPKGKVIAVDTETTGLSVWLGDRPFCITFCNEIGETGYYYWNVHPETRNVNVLLQDLISIKKFFSDITITKVFHNSKFDIRMIESIGVEITWKMKSCIEDTFIAAHCLRSNDDSLGLKQLAKKYINFTDDDEKELREATIKARHEAKKNGYKIAEKEKGLPEPIPADYWMAPKNLVLKYAISDVERTILLWKLFKSELNKDNACMKIYKREMEILKIIYEWESRGLRLNEKNVIMGIKKCKQNIINSKNKLDKFMNYNFNPNSTKHAIDLVYNKLKFPIKYRSKKSNDPAVNYKALVEIDHPMVKLMRDYDASQNLINMFETFKRHAILENDGHKIVHFHINPVGTTTGRFATRNPNIMSASGNTRGTSTVTDIITRSAFSPRYGYDIFCLDYIAQEVWIFADGSRDETMLNVLLSGGDIHTETALAIWGQKALDYDKKMGTRITRAKAKLTNFGIIYGIGYKSLAALVKCSETEAQEMLRKYKLKYPGIPLFADKMSKQCLSRGYIETAFGRKIWMNHDWQYRACNYYVQGTAADVMKTSIIKVNNYLNNARINAYILLTLHDEMILEIGKDINQNKVLKDIIALMEDQPYLKKINKRLGVEVSKLHGSWANKVKYEIKK